MIDYRKFLEKKQSLVLPYLGGKFVESKNGTFHLKESPEPGYYLFEISGRKARILESVENPDLSGLPKLRGHLFRQSVVLGNAMAERVYFFPEEQLPRFSIMLTRRSYSGELLFEGIDFEGDAEEQVRQAFEDGRALSEIPGIPATLRTAFSLEVFARESERLGIPFLPIEVRPWILEVAEKGSERAADCLRYLHQERTRRVRRQPPVPVEYGSTSEDEFTRVSRTLRSVGARLRDLRYLGDNQLEVRYEFLGTRLTTIVMGDSLRVVDAGICLEGEDSRLTLDSLPGAVREAMETDRLVVTCH